MNEETRSAILELAKDFVGRINKLDDNFFSTIVVTHNADAVVVGDDNPLNALAALSHGLNAAGMSATDIENFIYADTARH